MNDNDITRFIDAQDSKWSGFNTALREIKAGRKTSHWIWYIFPQLRGLGHSRMSYYYGITGSTEAEEYLSHPILGARLREITTALLRHKNKRPEAILGSIDAQKVRSCMTLFDCISPEDIFAEVLDTFYNGQRDPKSII